MTKVLTQSERVKNRIFYNTTDGRHTRFWLMMAGFMGLIFTRNVFDVNFPITVLLIYFCVMAVFSDRDEIIALSVSCVPFTAAFQYRYALLAFIVIYLFKFPKSVKNYFAFIPLLLMMVWEVFHGISYSFSFVTYLQQFSELLFCSFVISLSNKKFNYKLISRVLAVSTVFVSAVLLIKVLETANFDFAAVFVSGKYRLGINDYTESSYVLNYNANMLGIMCNLAISGILLRMKIDKADVLDISLAVSLAFFGFLTLSRTFVVCLAMIILMFIVSSGVIKLKTIKNGIMFLFIALIALFVLYLKVPYVFDNIINRFNEEDITNGRSTLFAYYNDHIFSSFKYFVFGVGVQNILDKMAIIHSISPADVPHSGFQEIVVGWGIVGFAFFISFLLIMIFTAKEKVSKMSMNNFIPFVLVIVAAQTGQLITSGYRLVSLTFAYIALCVDFSESKELMLKDLSEDAVESK